MSDDDKAGFAGGQAGAFASAAEAAASEQVRVGADAFRRAAESLANVDIGQSKGNLFEYIEALRFNEHAALQGESFRARVTAAVGRPTDAADIEIVDGRKIVERIQAKVSERPQYMAHSLRQEKYAGMQRLVPKDAESRVHDLTDRRAGTGNIYAEQYKDSARNLTGEAHYADVRSGGTTIDELHTARNHPDVFAALEEARAVGRQAAKAGAAGAVSGAVVAAAISSVKAGYRFSRGELEGEEAVFKVIKSTGRGALRGGATGAGGAVVSHVAAKVGAENLAKTNIATTIAASTIQAGVNVYAFARGEISGEELAENLGQNGVSTMSSLYVGAAAGAVFGPVGALVGSIVGYMVASDAYTTTMAILRDARLTREEAERLEALAEECIAAMEDERSRIDEVMEAVDERRHDWMRMLDLYDAAIATNNSIMVLEATTNMACLVGIELKFASFEEFDAFMSDLDSGPLLL